ncbi:MAG: TIGR03667 family PPOX class F420-dependent oxidoreductase [Thermomicrobiales bacterium]
MTSTIDFSTDFGKHALDRLETEQTIWLTVVTPSGKPSPNPVWFIWHDGKVLIFSEPNVAKVKAMLANPAITLHFDAGAGGEDVVVFNGTADATEKHISPEQATAYLIKYRDGIEHIGLSPESMFAQYSRAIEIDLTKLRGFVG